MTNSTQLTRPTEQVCPTEQERTARTRRAPQRLRAVVTGIVIAAAAVLGTALPASAHDELISSTPEVDAVLETAPTEIVLGFSGDVLEGTATVVLLDADGTDHVSGAPEVLSGTVTTPVAEGLKAGAYEVRWAVTSEDGHPISGVIPFTIDGAASPEPTNSAEPTTPPSPTATAGPGDSAAPTATPDENGQGLPVAAIVAIVIGGLVVLGIVIAIVMAALRRRSATGSTGTSSDDAPRS
ncbi:hypothetical protein GCM10025768_06650 [Microbacterium pseudoresistens]|uniref:Methionine-rich copper-binding protein CopC n=1 Tax=Microbacterium pseudoresistens TaxID=640634 RepID=A0A7Y9JM84_9MICO|nr:copper resistance CopC family protein [Microbacterium pseudoresistens]NYD54502.1 methionine-rich copper-binding protein CopC [Microbacterium pseudoresistens]